MAKLPDKYWYFSYVFKSKVSFCKCLKKEVMCKKQNNKKKKTFLYLLWQILTRSPS